MYTYMQTLDLLVAIGNIMLTQKKELSILLMMKNRLITLCISIALILSLISSGTLASVKAASSAATSATSPTSTAINHLVVSFQENVSFDHYFGTYPSATNPPGEPKF
jgi:phospholipase C